MIRKTINCIVMFADVAGSTTIYENMGDELARERISNALNTLIDITKRHKGTLVKTIGDEILVYFTDVDMAILAAHSIQEVMEDDRKPETIGVSIRIGMQFGSAIVEANDIFGDTVNVAARIASMAKARQILCTKEIAFMLKSFDLSNNMRPFDRIRVRGKSEPLDIYMFSWEKEGDITNMATASSFTNPARQKQGEKLTLTYRDKRYKIPVTATSYIIGRGKDCELFVDGDLISRHHSKIEHRRGKFIITDQSTNGTFIKTQEGQEVFLRREELTLFGVGFISLGKEVDQSDDNVIQFYSE
ncbi:MAG: adenylate cyclase [Gammaproteobacteria bacterium]|jgi:adenylate cyclase